MTQAKLSGAELSEQSPFVHRLWRTLIGAPRGLSDKSLFHHLSLIPFLAWVGLGADGLSSSSYGPEEAFRALGEHPYLAVPLALLMISTVLIISLAYSRIIETFPSGGGGYLVATKLLGPRTGVVSGSALVVDYILTITISIAAAGDALFSFVPLHLHSWKLTVDAVLLLGLTTLNLRGVRESVVALTPVFIIFVITHLILIGYGLISHTGEMQATAAAVAGGFSQGMSSIGVFGMLLLLLRAFSLGGGTYTGIEAVSNGLPIMREPRVPTAKRTMLYMASSLAFTAAGLLLCYLLWNVSHVPGKTMNAVLTERVAAHLPFSHAFVFFTLISEGALLIVAAQAGFIDGPRVLANMAVDSWMPHRFSALSDRLTTQNGILLMSGAALGALLYTHGNVSAIVVMYSINVFLTFSLSMLGMLKHWLAQRKEAQHWRRQASLFAVGLLLCGSILAVTVFEKFTEGGWMTVVVTGALVGLAFIVRQHYGMVYAKISELYQEDMIELAHVPAGEEEAVGPLDPSQPTAILLVSSYSGLGIHTMLNIFRIFPGYYKNLLFVTVGVVDSGLFKGEETVDALQQETEKMLARYLRLAKRLRIPCECDYELGTDAVDEAEKLCSRLHREFPKATFFVGKIVFQRERWYQRLLHNETAFAIQRRLQWSGQTMVVIPARMA
ncbi:MAG: APC family permease [Candidatus Electronema sp. V4]|uniref:APC family permease n=1 Tax=Candidatus Electronema sp. V4 TaxID=3454756 RepID=UPI0040554CCC